MIFYLGTHMLNWLELTDVPLFVSHRRLSKRHRLPQPRGVWALDSGGFSELDSYGEWRTTTREYVRNVRRFRSEMLGLAWVAPQDWMCEPHMLRKTGLDVAEHQRRTVRNYLRLRELLGDLVIPVLQGWTVDDYLRCWQLYGDAGVDLEWESLVGLGSVCRRQATPEAAAIVQALSPLRLHYFGAKITGLSAFGQQLVSADSMAWSFDARRAPALLGHSHKNCANCIDWALSWRQKLLDRLEAPCPAN